MAPRKPTPQTTQEKIERLKTRISETESKLKEMHLRLGILERKWRREQDVTRRVPTQDGTQDKTPA